MYQEQEGLQYIKHTFFMEIISKICGRQSEDLRANTAIAKQE